MSSFFGALQYGALSVWLPLMALIAVLLYSLWIRWRYRIRVAERVKTTSDHPEFLRSSGQRRERILSAGDGIEQAGNRAPAISLKWIIIGIASILLLIMTGLGVRQFGQAVEVIESGELAAGGTLTREKACEKFPGLC
jgi:hypothetical protein